MEVVVLVILLIFLIAVIFKLNDIKNALRRLPDIEHRLHGIEQRLKPAPTATPAAPTPPPQPSPPIPLPTPVIPHAEPPIQTMYPAPVVADKPLRPATPPALPLSATAPQPPVQRAPPAQPPAWVESATAILQRVWQWILVGEEFRPKGVAMEYAVATTWLVRVGIIALVACVAYFLKWSIQRELIGPSARVAITILFGLGILIGGRRLLAGRYQAMGQAFIGGGLATLYFSMYALGPMYHLLQSRAVVFALMGLVTLSAGILALESNAMIIAILGIIGGFCTPIMLSTGVPNFPALYGYLLLLNLGILAISLLRPWRLLNYLGFVFTYGLFVASLQQYQRSDFPIVITFLALFFAVHSTLVFIHNLRRRLVSTVLEVIHLVLNAGCFSVAGYYLIIDALGRPYPAIVTLALAFYYVIHTTLFLRARLPDRPLLLAVVSLSVFYAVMTMPLVLEQESLTIAWALQAYLFLRLGRCMGNPFLSHLGFVLYGITAVRLAAFEFPRFDAPGIANPANWSVYGQSLAHRLWTFGTVVASLLGAFHLERRRQATLPDTPPSAPDIAAVVPTSLARPALFWAITACVFLYLQFEFHALFSLLPPWQLPAMTGVWCVAAIFFILLHRATGSSASLAASLFFAAGAIVKGVFFDLHGWHLSGLSHFSTPYIWPGACARILEYALVIFILAAAALLLRTPIPSRIVPAVFGYASLAVLWLYGTFEIATLLHWTLPAFQKGGVSVWWTLFAFGMLAGGIWSNIRPIRYVALLLFTIVIIKVFFNDLSGMPMILRVAALLALGVLLLLGAFVYLRAGKRFAAPVLLLALLGASTAGAAIQPRQFPKEKQLTPAADLQAEIGQWLLDNDQFAALDERYANMRLFDADGHETPFLIRTKADSRTVEHYVPVPVSSSVESLKQHEDNSVELIVSRKTGDPEVAGIQFDSRIRNFEKLVTVSGSNDRASWTPLIESAPIYDYSRFIDLRRDRVSFPPSRFTAYRIEISNMTEKQDSPLVGIIRQTRGAETPTETEATSFRREPFRIEQIRFLERRQNIVADAVEAAIADASGIKVETDEKNRSTRISFETSRQPVTAVTLLSDDSNFSRPAVVAGETETAPRTWQHLAAGTVSRIRFGGVRQEQLTIELPPARYSRYCVIIRNMDNPPLRITGVQFRHNRMVGLFFPKSPRPHRLCYGGEDIPAPVYDVASVLASAVPGTVQEWKVTPEHPNPDYSDRCGFRLCSGKTGLTLAIVLMAALLLVLIVPLAKKINLSPG